MFVAAMSILNRRHVALPTAVPATISFHAARLASTDRVRHLLSIPAMRSSRIVSTGVSSAYRLPALINRSARSSICGK